MLNQDDALSYISAYIAFDKVVCSGVNLLEQELELPAPTSFEQFTNGLRVLFSIVQNGTDRRIAPSYKETLRSMYGALVVDLQTVFFTWSTTCAAASGNRFIYPDAVNQECKRQAAALKKRYLEVSLGEYGFAVTRAARKQKYDETCSEAQKWRDKIGSLIWIGSDAEFIAVNAVYEESLSRAERALASLLEVDPSANVIGAGLGIRLDGVPGLGLGYETGSQRRLRKDQLGLS